MEKKEMGKRKGNGDEEIKRKDRDKSKLKTGMHIKSGGMAKE